MIFKRGSKKQKLSNLPKRRIQTAEGWRRQILRETGKNVRLLPPSTPQE